jgi:predicted GNAT superfamily acetyltransferase
VAALGPAREPPPSADLLDDGAEVAVVDDRGEPTLRETTADRRLLAVPPDIVEIRRQDPGRSSRWRSAFRVALEAALAAGHAVTSVTPEGFLVTDTDRVSVASDEIARARATGAGR